MNVPAKLAPIGVNVTNTVADPPETNPFEGLAVYPYGAWTE